MSILNLGKKKQPRKNGKTPPTPRKALEDLMADTMKSELEDNPELRRKIAFKEFGYEDLIKPEDPIQSGQKQLKKFAIDRALQRIENDPDLANNVSDAMIEEITGKRDKDDKSDFYDNYNAPNSIDGMLEQLEGLSTLQGRLKELGLVDDKTGGGFFAGLNLREIIQAVQSPSIQDMLGQLVNNGDGSQSSERMILVQIDGSTQEIPESKYRKLVEQGKIKPIAELTEGKTQPEPKKKPKPVKIDSEVVDSLDEPFIPIVTEEEESVDVSKPEDTCPTDEKPGESFEDLLNNIKVEAVWDLLKMTPEEFIQELTDGIKEEDPDYKFMWSFLQNTILEGLVYTIEQYREHEKIGEVAEYLITDEGHEWLGNVIGIIQTSPNPESTEMNEEKEQ